MVISKTSNNRWGNKLLPTTTLWQAGVESRSRSITARSKLSASLTTDNLELGIASL